MRIKTVKILNELHFQGILEITANNPLCSFKEIEKFPKEKGVYIIYDEKLSEIVYVGIAHTGKRTIEKRCRQNLNKGDNGGTFRKKLEKRLNIDAGEAVKYIKYNCKAWFVVVDSDIPSKDIKRIEHLLIGLINPIDND